LIQEKQKTENIDSRNCLLGVKNCTLNRRSPPFSTASTQSERRAELAIIRSGAYRSHRDPIEGSARRWRRTFLSHFTAPTVTFTEWRWPWPRARRACRHHRAAAPDRGARRGAQGAIEKMMRAKPTIPTTSKSRRRICAGSLKTYGGPRLASRKASAGPN
jgi:hypothetical protein